jgi:type III secretory pathway component EscV
MSAAQINNNNRMQEIIQNIEYVFGIMLVYSIIIFITLSALLGGIFASPIYAGIYIFNKMKNNCCQEKEEKDEKDEEKDEAKDKEKDEEKDEENDEKPIIDENWCNINVKNIINYQRKSQEYHSEEEEEQSEEEEEQSEEEEVLSLKIPEYICSSKSESEEESEEDNSPNDKYSLYYKQDQVDLPEN